MSEAKTTKLGTVLGLVTSSPFIRNNAVFFFGSLVVAFLNYLFYPLLGRILEPSEFGEVQALISIYSQIAIFLTILTYVTIHVTVNIKNLPERNKVLLSLERLAFIFGLVVMIISLMLANQVKEFLNFTEVLPIIVLIITFVLTIPLTLRMAFLRGKKHFAKAVFSDGIGSFVKLILASIFVLMGLGATGAVSGLAISQIISLCFAVFWAVRAGLKGFGLKSQHADLRLVKPQLGYAIVVFVAISVVTAIFSLDILAVKHYFSPEVAGLYAGISTIARIVYFLTAPITGVLLTMISLNQSAQKNRLQFFGSLALIGCVGLVALIPIAIFPNMIIKILVGSNYLVFAGLLPRLSLAMLVLALANATLLYNIALRRYKVAILAVAPLIMMVSLLYLNHANVGDIVNNVLISSSSLLLITVGYTLVNTRSTTKEVYG